MRIPRESMRAWLGVLLMAVSGGTAIALPPTPPSTLSYQARVIVDGEPAEGIFDLEAARYDSSSGCCQVGSTVTLTGVEIIDGLLSVELDFGLTANDPGRWLELRLRPSGSGSSTALEPRHELTSAPIAIHAWHALEADTSLDALLLNGNPASYYQAWSHHTGVPGDIADGDDDALAVLGCASGEVAVWTSGGWTCGEDAGLRHATTHVVNATGSPTENGSALLAALAAIPTPTVAAEAQLLKLGPGHYDLDGQALVMKPWVDVEGSGQRITVIASDVCLTTAPATIVLADDCELRQLSVENTCALNASGIDGLADRVRISDVTARATSSGGTAYGMGLMGEHPVLQRVTATAEGGLTYNCGLSVISEAGGVIRDVTAEGRGGMYAGGVYAYDFERVERIEGSAFDGSSTTYGVELRDPRFARVVRAVADSSAGTVVALWLSVIGRDVGPLQQVVADGATAIRVAVQHFRQIVLSDVELTGSIGIYGETGGWGDGTLTVHDSTISGSTNTISSGDVTIFVAGSRMLGGPVAGPATCAAITDESNGFYASTCPP